MEGGTGMVEAKLSTASTVGGGMRSIWRMVAVMAVVVAVVMI